jgi:ADP-heptose:LPS heptosyltransferase
VSEQRIFRRFGREYLAPTWYPRALVEALAVVDAVRRPFLRSASPVPVPPLAGATIAIAKTDHLGDLIQATALFRALRDDAPTTQLVLIHGSWSRPMAEWLRTHDYVHELVEYDPAWMQPSTRSWPQRLAHARYTLDAAAATLQRLRPVAFLDIRSTSPHALTLAVKSGAPVRIGYGLRGRGWQYHHRIPYDVSRAIGQNWLHVLEILGLPSRHYAGPVLPAFDAPRGEAPIVLQPGSRTLSKEVSLESWHHIVRALAPIAPLVLVGSAGERARYGELATTAHGNRVLARFGATEIDGLVRTIASARAVVGVESVAAHIGLGAGIPVVVLDRAATSGRAAFPAGAHRLSFVAAEQTPELIAEQVRSALTCRSA